MSQKEGSDESLSKRSSAAEKSPEKSPEHVRRAGIMDEPKVDMRSLLDMLNTGSDELSSPEDEEEEVVVDVVETIPDNQSPRHKGVQRQGLPDKLNSPPEKAEKVPTKPHQNGNLNGSREEDDKEVELGNKEVELGVHRRKTQGADKGTVSKTDTSQPKESIRAKEDDCVSREEHVRPKVKAATPKEDTVTPEEDSIGSSAPSDEHAELDDNVPSVADPVVKRRSDIQKRESSHGGANRRSKAISGDQALGIFYYNRRSQVFDGADLDDLDRKIKDADARRGNMVRQQSAEKSLSPMPPSPLLSKPRVSGMFPEKAHHEVLDVTTEEVAESETEAKGQNGKPPAPIPAPQQPLVPTPAAPTVTPTSVQTPEGGVAQSVDSKPPEPAGEEKEGEEEVSPFMLQLIQQQAKRRGVANKAKVMRALLDENEVTIDDHPKAVPAKLAEVME